MDVPVPALYGFALVLMRTAGLCASAPLLGSRPVPARVRLALALGLSLALFSAAGAPAAPLPTHLVALAGAALRETLLGLAAGLGARLALEAATTAGHLAGLSMGLGYGALVDPFHGAESTALSQLLSFGALGAAIALGLHREAVAWLAYSLRALPPGAAVDFRSLFWGVALQATVSLALAVRLAFPVLAAATLGHLVLGGAGRLAPQLNLSSVGFSVSLLAGGLALFALAPTLAAVVAQHAVASFSHP